VTEYNEEGTDIRAYFNQPEPSEEGLAALKVHRERTKVRTLSIVYQLANFDKLLPRDILCTIECPYQIMVVKAVKDSDVYVHYINPMQGQLTGAWISKQKINDGSIGKLTLE
jgi:hypothetical protein